MYSVFNYRIITLSNYHINFEPHHTNNYTSNIDVNK